MRRRFCFLVLFVAAGLMLRAEDLVTGPPVGTDLGSVSCYANSGPFAGRESFDVAQEIGDKPGAMLFVHVLNRNTAPVIRGIDHLAREYGLFGFRSFVVTLSDDRTAAEEQLRRVNRSLKLDQPMVLNLDGLDGPGSLALNRRCTLSLILTRGGRVVESIGFTDTGLYDLERIRAAARKAIGDIPTERGALLALAAENLPSDPEAVRRLAASQAVDLYGFYHQSTEDYANSRRYGNQQSMQRRRMNRAEAERPGNRGGESVATEPASGRDGQQAAVKRERRGGPPEDDILESLLRSYIRKTHEAPRIDELYQKIVERSRESEGLDKQAIAMFQLMLSFPDRYGTAHAQELARGFLKERGTE